MGQHSSTDAVRQVDGLVCDHDHAGPAVTRRAHIFDGSLGGTPATTEVRLPGKSDAVLRAGSHRIRARITRGEATADRLG